MKKSVLDCSCIMLVAMLICSGLSIAPHSKVDASSAEVVSVTLSLEEYEIIGAENERRIDAKGYGSYSMMGMPNIPGKTISIAIPPGTSATGLDIDLGECVMISGTHVVAPVSMPYEISGTKDSKASDTWAEEYENNYASVYETSSWYPEKAAMIVDSSGYRGYNLVDVKVSPFRYQPMTGELCYYPEITIEVSYAFDESTLGLVYDDAPFAMDMATERIINAKQAEGWLRHDQSTKESYDFVIVTLDSLVGAVDNLKKWEEYKGRAVKVVTTSWIYENYEGYDNAAQIRSFLREKYPTSEWGIQYVCIVGTYDDVPMRRTSVDIGYGGPQTDWYYAELSLPDNASWDKDEDHRYGERSDDVDFFAEVIVGRIPWSDDTTVRQICEKSIIYENDADPSFKNNILLLGAFFWDSPRTDNAVLMERIVENEWFNDWTMTRLYEEGHSMYEMDSNLTNANVMDLWSEGRFAFVDWAGHGSPWGCYRYHPSEAFILTSDCAALGNDYPSIIFADACSNGDTDEINLGMSMLKQGGIGFVGATKVAMGCPAWSQPTDGSSQSLDYYFTTAVTSGEYTQGAALTDALHTMYQYGLWGDQYYEGFEWASLLGNPALGMTPVEGNMAPDMPMTPEGAKECFAMEEVLFSSTTVDTEGDEIYYMFDWGDDTYSEWIGPVGSGDLVNISHIWTEEGAYEIRVIAKDDALGLNSTWSERLNVEVSRAREPGLSIGLIVGGILTAHTSVTNTGTIEATGVAWNMSFSGENIWHGRESSGIIESISVGETVNLSSDLILGFGNGYVTMHVSCDGPYQEHTDTRDQTTRVVLCFIKVNGGSI